MKSIFKLLGALCFLTLFSSCEKESEGLSRVTFFADLTLEGESFITVAVGDTYVDPGYSAVENGEDVTDQVVVSEVNTSTTGISSIRYSIANADGIEKVDYRTLMVTEASDRPVTGTYDVRTVRTEADGSDPRPRVSEIDITDEGDDVFYVSGLLGYYYAAGYGATYAVVGKLKLNADNTLTLIESYNAGWDDELAGFQNGTFDPSTGVIYWESIYAGGDIFAVTGILK